MGPDDRMALMQRTVEATIDAEGKVELKEPLHLPSQCRALVTILDEKPQDEGSKARLPQTREELVEYWDELPLFGSRPDIEDGQEHARKIRRQASHRLSRIAHK